MATTTVNGLPQIASPVATDKVSAWDTSAGTAGYITLSGITGTAVTGGGTVATGGYTLTVPATGTAALLGSTNTFTRTQTMSPTPTTDTGIAINMPVSTSSYAQMVSYNSTNRIGLYAVSSSTLIYLLPFDNGSGSGPTIRIGRNSNGSTPGAGSLSMQRIDGADRYIWPDSTGVLRISTSASPPTNATDTSGTVVGAQTSNKAFKTLIGDGASPAQAISYIRDAVSGMSRFVYKNGEYNGEEFDGIILRDDEQNGLARYGMDADADHTAGKSLNFINAISDLMRVVADQAARIEKLEEALSNG